MAAAFGDLGGSDDTEEADLASSLGNFDNIGEAFPNEDQSANDTKENIEVPKADESDELNSLFNSDAIQKGLSDLQAVHEETEDETRPLNTAFNSPAIQSGLNDLKDIQAETSDANAPLNKVFDSPAVQTGLNDLKDVEADSSEDNPSGLGSVYKSDAIQQGLNDLQNNLSPEDAQKAAQEEAAQHAATADGAQTPATSDDLVEQAKADLIDLAREVAETADEVGGSDQSSSAPTSASELPGNSDIVDLTGAEDVMHGDDALQGRDLSGALGLDDMPVEHVLGEDSTAPADDGKTTLEEQVLGNSPILGGDDDHFGSFDAQNDANGLDASADAFGDTAGPAADDAKVDAFGNTTEPSADEATADAFGDAAEPAADDAKVDAFGDTAKPAADDAMADAFGDAAEPAADDVKSSALDESSDDDLFSSSGDLDSNSDDLFGTDATEPGSDLFTDDEADDSDVFSNTKALESGSEQPNEQLSLDDTPEYNMTEGSALDSDFPGNDLSIDNGQNDISGMDVFADPQEANSDSLSFDHEPSGAVDALGGMPLGDDPFADSNNSGDFADWDDGSPKFDVTEEDGSDFINYANSMHNMQELPVEETNGFNDIEELDKKAEQDGGLDLVMPSEDEIKQSQSGSLTDEFDLDESNDLLDRLDVNNAQMDFEQPEADAVAQKEQEFEEQFTADEKARERGEETAAEEYARKAQEKAEEEKLARENNLVDENLDKVVEDEFSGIDGIDDNKFDSLEDENNDIFMPDTSEAVAAPDNDLGSIDDIDVNSALDNMNFDNMSESDIDNLGKSEEPVESEQKSAEQNEPEQSEETSAPALDPLSTVTDPPEPKPAPEPAPLSAEDAAVVDNSELLDRDSIAQADIAAQEDGFQGLDDIDAGENDADLIVPEENELASADPVSDISSVDTDDLADAVDNLDLNNLGSFDFAEDPEMNLDGESSLDADMAAADDEPANFATDDNSMAQAAQDSSDEVALDANDSHTSADEVADDANDSFANADDLANDSNDQDAPAAEAVVASPEETELAHEIEEPYIPADEVVDADIASGDSTDAVEPEFVEAEPLQTAEGHEFDEAMEDQQADPIGSGFDEPLFAGAQNLDADADADADSPSMWSVPQDDFDITKVSGSENSVGAESADKVADADHDYGAPLDSDLSDAGFITAGDGGADDVLSGSSMPEMAPPNLDVSDDDVLLDSNISGGGDALADMLDDVPADIPEEIIQQSGSKLHNQQADTNFEPTAHDAEAVTDVADDANDMLASDDTQMAADDASGNSDFDLGSELGDFDGHDASAQDAKDEELIGDMLDGSEESESGLDLSQNDALAEHEQGIENMVSGDAFNADAEDDFGDLGSVDTSGGLDAADAADAVSDDAFGGLDAADAASDDAIGGLDAADAASDDAFGGLDAADAASDDAFGDLGDSETADSDSFDGFDSAEASGDDAFGGLDAADA
ncbi:hypothetical protein, partial [Anaerobiospirillum succiniciproducens]|uniref:hypothetical protein n=1 Tax=Anaerobiospirillum succiniciproducens TaxID=13335 RepID=UPI0005C444F6